MATVTPTLSLVSNDALVDKLNLSVTDSLAITGQAVYGSAVMADDADFTLAAADYTISYVYVKNMSTNTASRTGTDTIDIQLAAVDLMTLAPGEFAFFPWHSGTALNFRSASGTPTLEYGIFEF